MKINLRHYLILYLLGFCCWYQTNAQMNTGWDSIMNSDISHFNHGQFSGIAVDGENIHLLHLSMNSNTLYYTYSNDHGKTWKREVIDDSSNYKISKKDEKNYFFNWRGTIKLDSKGNPHVNYRTQHYNSTQYGYIFYARRTTTGKWQREKISEYTNDSAYANSYGECSMAIDEKDQPHIAMSTNKGVICYAKKTNGTWKFFTLPGEDILSEGLSISLDKNSNPHIASGSINGVRNNVATSKNRIVYFYSSDSGSTWISETISADTWWETDIAIDTNGVPYVTWRSLTNGIFCAYKQKNGDWETCKLSSVVHGANPMLCTDKINNVVYCSSYSNYSWKKGCTLFLFKHLKGKEWETEVVSSTAMSSGSAAKPGMFCSDENFYLSFPCQPDNHAIYHRKIPGGKKKHPVQDQDEPGK